MMPTFWRTVYAGGALALALSAQPLHAQDESAPSLAQCRGWSTALATGGPGAQRVLAESWLGGCPDIGPQALADAVTRFRSETDASVLWSLTSRAGLVTHPQIFEAALAVTGDRAASIPARAASLLILSAQIGGSVSINRVGGPVLLTEPRPASGLCATDLPLYAPAELASVAMASDAPRRVAALIDPLQLDAQAPVLLRRLARCVRPHVGREIPPQVDVSGLRASYACGTRFTIRNAAPVRLPFAVEVEGTDERYTLALAGGDSRPLTLDSPGTLRLVYDGRVIQSVANGATTCPSGS